MNEAAQLRPVSRALLSVSDKTGLVDLARGLARQRVELVSTGGTAAALRDAGLAVTSVDEVTGFPEILDGRVKTLHPAIHAGLLARVEPAHEAALREHGLARIDLLVVNLYPFEAKLAAGAPRGVLIETIDVGGPAMIRAAAKNHDAVAVLTDPSDYAAVLGEIEATGGTSLATRRRLAARAFALTAAYDALIAGALAEDAGAVGSETLPERLTLAGRSVLPLRYGENPHQRAAFYATGAALTGLAAARRLQGKELSYNNLQDADAALSLVDELAPPAAVIVKHANPCGAAIADDVGAAWRAALAGDPVSAFGGIVALNRPVDAALASTLAGIFLEVVLAPAFGPEALAVLARKADLRLLQTTGTATGSGTGSAPSIRSIAGGLLVQDQDRAILDPSTLVQATRRAPSPDELADLLFAWTVVKHVRSNAIVLARGRATVGIGMGQTNRVDAVRLAGQRLAEGPGAGPCVMASDAFFPFPDGIDRAAEAGVTAVIQPGGSVRDPAVVEAADRHGMAMLLTGRRHFRH